MEHNKLSMDEELFDDMFNDVVEVKEDSVSEEPEATPAKEVEPVEEQSASASAGFVQFGAKVSTVPIARLKCSKDVKCRVAILSKQVLTEKIHYAQGIGTFECMGGKCCDLEGLPKVRYILPVVLYTTNKDGKIVDKALEVRALALGAEAYSALADAVQFSGRDVTDVDIVITCSDEQYQKLTFAADASRPASWKQFPTAKETANYYKTNKDKLYMAVCRRISMDSYLTKKGFVTGAPAEGLGVGATMEDILG